MFQIISKGISHKDFVVLVFVKKPETEMNKPEAVVQKTNK